VKDTLTRFVLDSAPVRGGIVRLDQAYLDAIVEHDYPPNVARALGELLSAVTLVASSLKWDGSLILQIQSEGPVKLLCAEAGGGLLVRAVATTEGHISPDVDVLAQMPDARAVLTLDPKGAIEGASLYQGIVAVEPEGIAQTLEGYMLNSQQVATCVMLTADATCAVGMFVQKLPGDDEASQLAYERIEALTRSLKNDELLTLDAQTILHRLFHDETVRILPEQSVRFACSCTPDRVLGALRLMGREEVQSILDEHGQVDARCQFCNRAYSFNATQLTQLFADHPDVAGNATKH
jgi:molecular chaperone Hsp33